MEERFLMSRPKSTLSKAEQQWNLCHKYFEEIKQYVEDTSFKEPDYNEFVMKFRLLAFKFFSAKSKFRSISK